MAWVEQTEGLPIWVSVPVVNARQILIYHSWLLEQVRADSQLVDDRNPWWSPSVGNNIFAKYEEMYHRIGELLHPALDPSKLSNVIRHRFFISEGIVDHPYHPGQQMIGMAILEKLTGKRIVKPEKNDKPRLPEARLTSGDPHFDLIAETILVFGEGADTVLSMNLDSDGLRSLLQYAIDLKNPKEAKARKQQEMDEAWWKAHETQQSAALRAAGLPSPFFPKLSHDE